MQGASNSSNKWVCRFHEQKLRDLLPESYSFPYKARSVIKIWAAEKSVNKEEHERKKHYKQWGQGFLAEK